MNTKVNIRISKVTLCDAAGRILKVLKTEIDIMLSDLGRTRAEFKSIQGVFSVYFNYEEM